MTENRLNFENPKEIEEFVWWIKSRKTWKFWNNKR